MQSLVEAVQQVLIEGIVDTHFVKIGFEKSKAKELAKRWSEIPSQYKRGINILGTKTPQEVEDTLKRLESKWSESKTGKEKAVKRHGIQGLVYGEDYIEFDTGHPDIVAYAPQNHKASQLIASTRIGPCEGKWCTAENKPGHWNKYTEKGIKFIYVITPETKYAVAVAEIKGRNKTEIFDQNDKKLQSLPPPMNLKKLLNQTHLIKIKISAKSELKNIIKGAPINADLNHLDISGVTDMSELFKATKFNGDISKWDVSHVTNMRDMFSHSRFNGDISRWDVSHVTDMRWMFAGSQFKGDISKWDVSKVTNMGNMFYSSQFNGDISKWNVSNVTYMRDMFSHSKFSGDISKWDVSNVRNMDHMFSGSKFNGDISKWNVSKVTDMKYMFAITQFNGDISKWNVSKVEDMNWMFMYSKFNGDISKWDVSKVTSMREMFISSHFDGDIGKWDVSRVTDMRGMFDGSPLQHNPPPWYEGR